MRTNAKLLLVALALGMAILGLQRAVPAIANPIGVPAVLSPTVIVGQTTTVTASWGSDEAGAAVLQTANSSPSSVGVFISAAAQSGGNDVGTITGISSSQLTIQDDADLVVDTPIILLATFRCDTVGTTQFTIFHNNATSSPSITLNCVAAGTGSGASLVVAIATPNALNCGGTVQLKAGLRNTTTGALDSGNFQFQTDFGLLTQTGTDTATLVLLASTPQAKVSASTIGVPLTSTDLQVLTGEVIIQNTCGTSAIYPGQQTPSIVLSAAPNVVPCGGTSTITATARDNSGHIIPGAAFHFYADTGGLISQPNSASSTSNTATLTITPGMGKVDDGVADAGIRSVTVTAYVGEKYNSIKVQQYCPGVDYDASVAPGKVLLNPATNLIGCGGTTFIGATVRDSKGQVPRGVNGSNGEEVSFLATQGGFLKDSSQSQSQSTGGNNNNASGTPTPSQTVSESTVTAKNVRVSTKNGALNVIFVADASTSGEVTISAAAGTAFGTTKITVNCPSAIPLVVSGSGGIFSPPNTGGGSGFGGAGIRPPNTGDAGLASIE